MPLFKTDLQILRTRLDKRAASLKQERLPHEPVWQDIARNFEPQFARPLTDGTQADTASSQAPRSDSALINSHPRTALSRLGAGMQGGITSPSAQWFRLAIGDPKLTGRPDVKAWLDECTRLMAEAFSASNIYTVLHQTYLHVGAFGTSASLIVPDDETTLHGILLDEGSYWLACDKRGNPATILRAFAYTADQILQEFGQEAVDADPSVKADLEQARNEKAYTIWNLVTPNDQSCQADIDAKRPYISVYWREGSSKSSVLAIRSYGYKPVIAPRWQILAGSYGFGPGHISLGDAKELQRLESDILIAIAKTHNPPVTVPEDMRDEPINSFPGGITYRKDGGMDPQRRPSIAPLYEVNLNLGDLRVQIQAVEQRIERNFFTDLFAMMLNLNARPKVMTAREVVELSQEKMALLGPVLTRMNDDLLNPLIDAAFCILADAGRLPEAPDILKDSAATYSVKYVSILHTEQQSTSRLGSMVRLLDFVTMLLPADPSCIDKIDTLQAIDEAAEVLSVPAGVIRSDDAVAAIQAGRAKQAAQAAAEAQAATMPGLARAGRDLSETRASPGSALETLLQGQQQ